MKDLSLRERKNLTQLALKYQEVQILQGHIRGYVLLVIGLYIAQVKKNTSSLQREVLDGVVRCIESEYGKGRNPARSLRKCEPCRIYIREKVPDTMVDRQIFKRAVGIAEMALTTAHSQHYGPLLPPGH